MTSTDQFLPAQLKDYALIADGERGALVGPSGELAWLCAPRWDSDAVFSSLIGGTGTYAVTPTNRWVSGGRYEDGTLIWRGRWVTDRGTIECRDALAYPGDRHRLVVLRQIIAVDQDATLKVVLDARAGFGWQPMQDLDLSDGVWTARTGSLRVRWTGGGHARPTTSRVDRHLELTLDVEAGKSHDLVLEITEGDLPDQPPVPAAAWTATEAAWHDSVPRLDHLPARRQSRHSYAVLAGLTSSGGGMVAAATTSLPEASEAGRNYDYRYVWIRDQCYAGQAVAAVEDQALLAPAVQFVGARLLDAGAQLAPAYTTTGHPVPGQHQLNLAGYPGGFDRVGNWVNQQYQLDAFGEALLLFSAAAEREVLDAAGWQAALVAAAAIAERWTEPDAGIWEIDDRAWTHSRLIAVAGLRAIAGHGPARGPQADWMRLADRITAHTSDQALHPDGHWQRSPDDPALDAALLLPALRGAIPPDDPRSITTLTAYTRDLTQHGYAYRFRHDDRPLSAAEGSFTLCGFLMSLATHQQGDPLAAIGWWERSLATCGPPMLLSEEYDVEQRQMRGNLPQAFVHALQLQTAAVLGGSGASAPVDDTA